MVTYTLGQVTLVQLRELMNIRDRGVLPELWEKWETGQFQDEEQVILRMLRRRLVAYKTQLVNEATIWSRAIYPLLAMAERDNIRAYSEVPLSAHLKGGDLRGEVDGALAGMGIEAEAIPPYLLVVEAKRGVEGHDPVAQLLGGLLCAGWRNHQLKAQTEQRLYGVFTIGDVWTFLQVSLTGMDEERPTATIASSREYTEKTEAQTILLLLKGMVAELLAVW